jgi:flagellar biosynthetic protein FliR
MLPGFSQFPEGQIIAFALIFLRIVAFVVAAPLIGSQGVPVPVKVLLSITLSMMLFPTMKFQNVELIQIGDQVVFLSFREICIGLFLGFMMRLFFFAVSIAGEIIGVSSGAAQAQLFNPAMGAQANVLEQFYMVMATLFFFGLNGHHIFLSGLAKSFELVPIADVAIRAKGFVAFTTSFQVVLEIGIKIAAPIMIAILITNLAMGVLGRAVPQINVFMTSMQVTFMVTLLVLIITVPFFVGEMDVLMRTMADQFMSVMKVL